MISRLSQDVTVRFRTCPFLSASFAEHMAEIEPFTGALADVLAQQQDVHELRMAAALAARTHRESDARYHVLFFATPLAETSTSSLST